MFRLKLAMIAIGCVVVFIGVQEYRVSRGTTAEAQAVKLLDLEQGQRPANNHLQIGEHVAVYPASVYSYSKSKYSSADPTDESKVDFAYYPIISHEHPFPATLAELANKYAGKEWPADVKVPEIENFAVLVKTKRFATIGSIPSEIDGAENVKGLVVNTVDKLNSDEAALVKQSFPGIDLEKVLILQEGRRPSSLIVSQATMAGGITLGFAGLAWLVFFSGSRS